MNNHTKEPWRVELVDMENDEKICIVSNAFDIVSPHVPKAIRKIEDAERIVQCVNACADMKDPAKEIAQLRADRAELLYVLQDVTASLRSKVMFDGNYLADAVNKSLGTANDLIKRMEANHE
jgi:uncharacterized protein with PhoU and TrkA domain